MTDVKSATKSCTESVKQTLATQDEKNCWPVNCSQVFVLRKGLKSSLNCAILLRDGTGRTERNCTTANGAQVVERM